MSERWTSRDALYQAIAIAVVGVLAGIAVGYVNGRPQGRDSLKAEVSVLRSQAAEAALVLDASPRVNSRFVRAHAEQLAQNVQREQERIAKLHLEPGLRDGQRFAHDAAQRLHRVVHAASDEDVTSQRSVPRIIAGELEALEHALQR